MIKSIKLFINRFNEFEIFRPIRDFWKIKSQKEIMINIVYMFLVSIICVLLIIFSKGNVERISNFYSDVVDAEINVVSLLLSFSIAYLTMLITASGNNIERLKCYTTKIKLDNKCISAYQILLIELTFSIYLEVGLLLMLILNKFIFLYDEIIIKSMFFIGEIIILFDVFVILTKLIKNIYFSFWKNS